MRTQTISNMDRLELRYGEFELNATGEGAIIGSCILLGGALLFYGIHRIIESAAQNTNQQNYIPAQPVYPYYYQNAQQPYIPRYNYQYIAQQPIVDYYPHNIV